MSETPPFSVFALSDATGELAHSMSVAAVRQFESHKAAIIRVPRINDKSLIAEYVVRAKACHGVIIFTFVSQEMRQELLAQAKQNNVVAIDVLGPVLDALSNYFHELPSAEPGLQYRLTQNYFKRTEAVEFTVKHDDGLGLDTIDQADILLLGISRTSKTPLSSYLAYHGYRCINVPIVKGIPLPKVVYGIDPKKIVGLTISPSKLAVLRATRLLKLGRQESEPYANIDFIKDEMDYAMKIFRDLGAIRMIDVTNKAIEETASDIIHQLRLDH
jgi:regulator of PEP synthase PpsR (kinase-PPPase family)